LIDLSYKGPPFVEVTEGDVFMGRNYSINRHLPLRSRCRIFLSESMFGEIAEVDRRQSASKKGVLAGCVAVFSSLV